MNVIVFAVTKNRFPAECEFYGDTRTIKIIIKFKRNQSGGGFMNFK